VEDVVAALLPREDVLGMTLGVEGAGLKLRAAGLTARGGGAEGHLSKRRGG
jgi:hypothetical protein